MDINKEVAEKVMSWKGHPQFEPSTNIQDAWLVVERMRELDSCSVCLDYNDVRNEWICKFIPYGKILKRSAEAQADTAPLAISKAALASIKETV